MNNISIGSDTQQEMYWSPGIDSVFKRSRHVKHVLDFQEVICLAAYFKNPIGR